ncbi:dethiobiotin synthase [Candidatus Symbiopectobacterium sp. 'North America']|uniref:dethiobiotin synthase n=1 Tax=Candidatus Symbiopectobacterium sp. 'North America' TaxID=2794574 RepID=UPI0018C9D27C|nr:dethiobiotin synthase [Candidatus Symbiopectobacterium sp. 'North America']MBG6244406.1 dethiobiotin synthase [Candidatus Symbiopectobacterium sp. 'North America']
MSKRWFITGTDTEVGKTIASGALLQAAARAGYRCAGYKPVASGAEMTPQGIRNEDACHLQVRSSVSLTYDEVNPLVFIEPTSPHIVSRVEQQPIDFEVMSRGLAALTEKADWVLVEGAGGWFTPLTVQQTYADWVQHEQLPVILVVGIKLGCINHALLTTQAVTQAGLTLAGWIANDIQPSGRWHQDYLETLQRHLLAPLLGEIPYVDTPHTLNLGAYLDITLLCV